VSFVREAHDWEVGVFASFFHVLHLARVSRDRADRLRWVPSKKGVFKVKFYFSSLASCEGNHFPWKSVWRTQALRRWRSSSGRQPLERFLQRIISGSERSSLWIDATCAKETGKL
jgi:hypothetical protein